MVINIRVITSYTFGIIMFQMCPIWETVLLLAEAFLALKESWIK